MVKSESVSIFLNTIIHCGNLLVLSRQVDFTSKIFVSVKERQDKLPTMHWLPTLHKLPNKGRFVHGG